MFGASSELASVMEFGFYEINSGEKKTKWLQSAAETNSTS